MFGIGKSANFLTTLAITLFTSELYPTPVRGNALFYTAIIDMIGFLTIPFITQEVSADKYEKLLWEILFKIIEVLSHKNDSNTNEA